MKIDFNEFQEMTMPCMNGGKGMMTVRMFNDDNDRIIPTKSTRAAVSVCIRKTQVTTSTISSAEQVKRFVTAMRKNSEQALCTSARKAHSIQSSTQVMRTW